MKIKHRVWLTADKTQAVPDGDPKAATLLCGAGGSVSEEVAKKFKLTENGAPGQPDKVPVPFPQGVNPSVPDGVNTAPNAPEATLALGVLGTAEKPAGEPPVAEKTAPVKPPAPVTKPKGATPGKR